MGVYDELKARGLIAQTTNEEKIRELLNGKPACRAFRADYGYGSYAAGRTYPDRSLRRRNRNGRGSFW